MKLASWRAVIGCKPLCQQLSWFVLPAEPTLLQVHYYTTGSS
jgi:hypothetical protein